VLRLARLMGGDLTYDHDGSESVFTLRLPLAIQTRSGLVRSVRLRRNADRRSSSHRPPAGGRRLQ
jgi:hypothetical protein